MPKNKVIESFIIKKSYITLWKRDFIDIDTIINNEKTIYMYLLKIVKISQKKLYGPFATERIENLDTCDYFVLHVNDNNFNDSANNNQMPDVFGWFISTSNAINIDIISDYGMIYWFNINIISSIYPDIKYKCHNPNKSTNNKFYIGNYGVLYDTGTNNIKSYLDITYHKSVYLTCEVDIVGHYKNYLDTCTLLLSPDNNVSNVMPQEIITYILFLYHNSLFQ